jgi:hypothetical protein
MAKNLTNIHRKLDRLTERLGALDTRVMTDARRAAAQMRLMQQSVNTIAALQADVATLTLEALKASRESAERTAQILAAMRKHSAPAPLRRGAAALTH